MKKILMTISLIAIVFLQVSKAQVSAYSFTSSSGTYTAITGGTVLIDGTASNMDDSVFAAITIPSFTFNGIAYTTAYVSTNGFITLGGIAPLGNTYNGISSTSGLGSGVSICPFSRDLDKATLTSASEMRWEVVGNEVIFQWQQMKRYNQTESFDFQIRLNKVTNAVSFVYKLNSGPGTSTYSLPEVGLRTSATDYNNRLVASGTEDWSTSLSGTSNTSTCRFTSTAPQKNFTTGLTYIWTSATCYTPTSLQASNITINSADIAWVAPTSGTPTSYDWKVVLSGAGSGGTAISNGTVSNPTVTANATGLTSGTAYDLYVRTFCGGSDYSNWAGPFAFSTLCSTATLPYLQDFESAVVPAIPLCTSIENAGTGNNWVTASVPGSGFTTKALKYGYNYSNAANAWFYTPGIQLTAGTSYTITFNYGNNSTTYVESLKVAYGTSASSSAMTSVLLDFPSINQSALQNAGNTFTAPSTNVYYFGFNCYSIANQDNLYVDNILIEVTPTCQGITPASFTATNATANSAVLNWTEPGTATKWQLQYGVSGFTLGTGTMAIVNTNPPYTLSGLISATNYQVYIRSICSPGDTSSWKGPIAFSTLCVDLTQFFENFDAVTVPTFPTCWAKVGTTGGLSTQTTNNLSSPNCLYLYSSSSTSVAMISMPALSNAGAGTHQLRFMARANYTTGAILEIGYLTNPTDPATFVLLDSKTLTLTYSEYTVTPGTAPGTNKYLAFRANYTPAYSLLIDNVNWEQIPTCSGVTPASFTATNATANSAILNWTEPGTATKWQLQYGVSGFTLGTGTTAIISSNPPYTLSGLISATNYQVYIRSICSAGDTSTWKGPVSFSTLCDPTTIPYAQDFESVVVPALPLCTSVENAGTGNNWVTASAPGNGFTSKALKYRYSSTDTANAWFYTQGIQLTAGTSYTLTFNYGNNDTTYVESLKVAYGTSASSTAMTTVLLNLPTINQAALQNASNTFTAPSTNVYYFGFNCYSISDQYNLYVDSININYTVVGIVKTPESDFNVNIYPNPSNGQFNMLMLSNTESLALAIYNLQGQVVYSEQLSGIKYGNVSVLNLKSLAKGMYHISLNDGKTIINKKVVIN